MKQDTFESETIRTTTGCGSLYVVIAKDTAGRPVKIFAQLGKSGTCARAQLEAFVDIAGTMVCELTNHHATMTALTKAAGHQCNFGSDSCINVLSRVLLEYLMELNNNLAPIIEESEEE